MLITDQRQLEILNNLIVINNDRIEGYNYAEKKINIPILKILFSRLTETSLNCRKELIGEVHKIGGKPQFGNVTSAQFFKAWLEVIAAVGKNDHGAILDSCVNEENAVIKSYESALNEEFENITTQHFHLFNRHCELIRSDHKKIENLRQVLLKHVFD